MGYNAERVMTPEGNTPPRAFGEDTDKAAYLHGDRVGRRMALIIGFLHLGFWKGILAIVLWPYYLGLHFSSLAP